MEKTPDSIYGYSHPPSTLSGTDAQPSGQIVQTLIADCMCDGILMVRQVGVHIGQSSPAPAGKINGDDRIEPSVCDKKCSSGKAVPLIRKERNVRQVPAVGDNAAYALRMRERQRERHHGTHTEAQDKYPAGIDRMVFLQLIQRRDQPRMTLYYLCVVRKTDMLKVAPGESSGVERPGCAHAGHKKMRVEVRHQPEQVIFITAAAMQQNQHRMWTGMGGIE